jgi:hypothetical protein
MGNKTRQKKLQRTTQEEQNHQLFPGLKYRPSGSGLKITEV